MSRRHSHVQHRSRPLPSRAARAGESEETAAYRHALVDPRHKGAWVGWIGLALICAVCACAEPPALDPDAAVSPAVEQMYVRGLGFLLRTQDAGGFWTGQRGREPGVVGLAVLAMLAHGDDPNVGPQREALSKALDFILSQADPQSGYIGNSMYNHGFATLALAEAYGAVDDDRLGPALRRAVNLILTAQSRNAAGAWRYSPTANDADTTVSGAVLVALFAARNAGIGVPEPAIDKALAFYRRVQNSDGGFGYANRGSSNLPRSAIGVLAFALAKRRESSECKAGVRYLAQRLFDKESSYYYYYIYYVSQALFQADVDVWRKWNEYNIRNLASLQSPDGSWLGRNGPAFSTSAALLSLAVNYRYLPIYER